MTKLEQFQQEVKDGKYIKRSEGLYINKITNQVTFILPPITEKTKLRVLSQLRKSALKTKKKLRCKAYIHSIEVYNNLNK